jgi:integrase
MVETLRTSGRRGGNGGLSARSTQIVVTITKAATAWATHGGMLNRDPLVSYKRPKVSSKPMSSWSTGEARSFLAATKDDRLAWAWAMLLTRGLRRGELCGLRWDDVDLDGSVARIVRTRVIVGGQASESLPKTAAGRRPIPLDPALIALLRRHRSAQAVEKLAAGAAYEDGGWLVADELGRPYYPDSLSAWFDGAIAKAGLRRIRLHDCRHTAASLMLAEGVPVKVVADLSATTPG